MGQKFVHILQECTSLVPHLVGIWFDMTGIHRGTIIVFRGWTEGHLPSSFAGRHQQMFELYQVRK